MSHSFHVAAFNSFAISQNNIPVCNFEKLIQFMRNIYNCFIFLFQVVNNFKQYFYFLSLIAEVGSSMIITSESTSKAFAISMTCCCPTFNSYN